MGGSRGLPDGERESQHSPARVDRPDLVETDIRGGAREGGEHRIEQGGRRGGHNDEDEGGGEGGEGERGGGGGGGGGGGCRSGTPRPGARVKDFRRGSGPAPPASPRLAAKGPHLPSAQRRPPPPPSTPPPGPAAGAPPRTATGGTCRWSPTGDRPASSPAVATRRARQGKCAHS